MNDKAGGPIVMRPIGVIRSGHTDPARTPIQPAFAEGCSGRAELLPEFAEGLRDIEGFSHIYIIYHLHRAGEPRLVVTPYLDDTERGVFATRSPHRPNGIGLSVVRLVSREGSVLHLDGVDVLDGTPLLDVKPYVPAFEPHEGIRSGWQEGVSPETARTRGKRGYRAGPDRGSE